MNKIEPLKWSSMYSVNDEVIDAQHQQLFDITNRLADIYEKGSGDLLPIFKDIIDFLSKHFHAEHMLMKKTDYPDLEDHMHQHQDFVDKIEKYLNTYRADDMEVTYSMLSFLRNWIFNHTTGIDIRYRDHIIKTREKVPVKR